GDRADDRGARPHPRPGDGRGGHRARRGARAAPGARLRPGPGLPLRQTTDAGERGRAPGVAGCGTPAGRARRAPAGALLTIRSPVARRRTLLAERARAAPFRSFVRISRRKNRVTERCQWAYV